MREDLVKARGHVEEEAERRRSNELGEGGTVIVGGWIGRTFYTYADLPYRRTGSLTRSPEAYSHITMKV